MSTINQHAEMDRRAFGSRVQNAQAATTRPYVPIEGTRSMYCAIEGQAVADVADLHDELREDVRTSQEATAIADLCQRNVERWTALELIARSMADGLPSWPSRPSGER